MILLDGFPGDVRTLAFAPDGRTLATGGDGPQIRFWDAVDGRPAGEIETRCDVCDLLAYGPTGRELLSVGNDGLVVLWDIDTRIARAPRRGWSWNRSLAATFHPDGAPKVLRFARLDPGRDPRIESAVAVVKLEGPHLNASL